MLFTPTRDFPMNGFTAYKHLLTTPVNTWFGYLHVLAVWKYVGRFSCEGFTTDVTSEGRFFRRLLRSDQATGFFSIPPQTYLHWVLHGDRSQLGTVFVAFYFVYTYLLEEPSKHCCLCRVSFCHHCSFCYGCFGSTYPLRR